jgi:hypothetical protein
MDTSSHSAYKYNDTRRMHHLGGNGPWIPKTDGPFGDDLSVPEGCQIEQVHMVGSFLAFLNIKC